MEWSDIWSYVKPIIGTAAPLLGTALGGPAGAAAGTLVAAALGVENKPDAVVEAIKANPEAVLKLKELELAHKVELERMILEGERIRLADVASARQREVDTTKATGKRDINLYTLAWVLVVGFFVLVGTLIFKELPKDSNGVIFMLFGTLATGFGCVTQYFFGSSKSSQEKTSLLAQAEPIKK